LAVIEEDVVIGEGCTIEAHAVVKRYTRLGKGNHLHEGAVLGGSPQDIKYRGGTSFLLVGDGNIFREHVTVNRSTEPDGTTRIGHHNFLMTSSHVAHECILGNHVVMANCVALAGHVRVEDHAFLSGGVVVHQFSNIGRHAMIGGNAKVTQDVLPFCLVDGVPARTRSLNLVGLRRAGFGREEIRSLKKAFRILSGAGPDRESRILQVQAIESDSVQYLVEFIQRSNRGFCGFGGKP
jgi:UDP-N-acetylglucosamine acyltransferase